MPAHNCEQYIRECIESIIAQTMPDFELIIVNDGSTDNSSAIARSFLDKRIKVIDLPVNRGCYPARNTGMRAAAGDYICVMDADDLCEPDRLENQFLFMEENRELGLAGGAYRMLGNPRIRFRETDYETIKLMMLKYCYLLHASCIVRTSLVWKHDLYYDESYKYASDHEWEARASSLFPVTNLNVPVYLYRRHDRQISTDKRSEQFAFIEQIRVKQLSFFGIVPTETEKALHLAFLKCIFDPRFDEKMIDQWINRLLEANRITNYYCQTKLKDFLQAHRYQYTLQIKQL